MTLATQERYGLKLFHPPEKKALTVVVRNGRTVPASYDGSSNQEPSYQSAIANAHFSALVVACLKFMAQNVTAAPIVMERKGRRGDTEIVDNHPLLDLLTYRTLDLDGNDSFKPSGKELLAVTVWGVFLSETGMAYWHKDRNGMGRVGGLSYLPHNLVEVRTNSAGVTRYVYSPGGAPPVTYEPEDIVHIRLAPDPFNPRLGICPLASLGRELAIDDGAGSWTAALLRNRATPGLVLAPHGTSTPFEPDQITALKGYAQGEFTGANRGKVGVLGVPVDFHQMGYNPSEMDLSAIRNTVEERVSAVLGIPAAIVGFGTGLEKADNRATHREMRRQAWEDTIIPLQDVILAQVISQILPEFEPPETIVNFNLYFDRSGVMALQEDENERADRLRADLSSGGITVRVWKEERGYEVFPGDNGYLRPLNIVQVPAGTGRPPGVGLAGRDIKALETKAAPTDLQAAFLEAQNRDEDRLTELFEASLLEAFGDLGERAADAFLSLELVGASAAARNGHHLKQPVDELSPADVGLAGNILAAMAIGEWESALWIPAWDLAFRRTYDTTVDTFTRIVGAVNIPDPRAQQIIALGGSQRGLHDIPDVTRNSIFRALAAGREAGEGPPVLARRIRDQVGAGRYTNRGANYRAQVISREETRFAQRKSSLEAYRASDVVDGVYLRDNQRGFNDDECSARDGTTVSFDEYERVIAEEHPNGTLQGAPAVRQ